MEQRTINRKRRRNEMDQQKAEQINERMNELILQLKSLDEKIPKCLTTMHFFSDEHEKATANKLYDAYRHAFEDSAVAEELSQLPTYMFATVFALAALKLAYDSIRAIELSGDLWGAELEALAFVPWQ
jgi:flagellar motility protein MotE (MotC chaperone)